MSVRVHKGLDEGGEEGKGGKRRREGKEGEQKVGDEKGDEMAAKKFIDWRGKLLMAKQVTVSAYAQ